MNMHALVTTSVNADGHREILGWTSPPARTAPGWLIMSETSTDLDAVLGTLHVRQREAR
jgi:transposase-like protein